MKNATSWFSIPANDFDRAKKFYEALYGTTLKVEDDKVNNEKMLMFPCDMKGGGAGGAITHGSSRTPSKEGTIVYLNFEGELQEVLDRVATAGGKVTTPKTPMGKMGDYAVIEDTEGNTVGVYSAA